MIPNLFIVGAPKCGTSAIAYYLSEHPNALISSPKEPFFWSDDIKASGHELRPCSLDEYLNLFKDANPKQHSILGEGSTSYLRSLVAVPNILKFNPDAKFIVMLRNPLDVVQAYHMEQVYLMREDQIDFAQAWALQKKREAGLNIPKNAKGSDHVLYRKIASFHNQVQRLLEIVPRDQVKIIIFDDFKENCEKEYKSVLRFLNLEDDKRDNFEPINSAHAQRWPLFAKLILYPPRPLQIPFRKLRRFLIDNDFKFVNWVKKKLNVKKNRISIDEDLKSEIKEYFKTDIDNLGTLLDRDLSYWYK